MAGKLIPLTAQSKMDIIVHELAMLNACQHPNVVTFYGSYADAQHLWVSL
jgi:hypothetical protein